MKMNFEHISRQFVVNYLKSFNEKSFFRPPINRYQANCWIPTYEGGVCGVFIRRLRIHNSYVAMEVCQTKYLKTSNRESHEVRTNNNIPIKDFIVKIFWKFISIWLGYWYHISAWVEIKEWWNAGRIQFFTSA